MNKRLTDLRFIIGLLFLVYGILVGGYGLFAAPASKTVDWNINLAWGAFMLVFGIGFMLWSRTEEKGD